MDEELPEDYLEEMLSMMSTKGWKYFLDYTVGPNMEACKEKALGAKDLYTVGDNKGTYDTWAAIFNMREMLRQEIEEQ